MILKFETQTLLLKAYNILNENSVVVNDVYSPHHIEQIHGVSKSNLFTRIAIVFGVSSFLIALIWQYYVLNIKFPQNYGNKPLLLISAYMPVAFEVMVFTLVIGLTLTFFIISKKTKNIDLEYYYINVDNESSEFAINTLINNNIETEIIDY